MTLKKYTSKRDVTKSHEPKAQKKITSGPLNFCVQKHAARRLHYDFRLECKGVLLSWAVPKGPSMDPKDKRLAIHVEDHPLDYQYFEGIIPKGNYGAGTVEIWDHGSFTTIEGNTRQEMENYLAKGMKLGHFSIIIHGGKLQGEFTFQKLKKDDATDNSWLLIKKRDGATFGSTKISKTSFKKKSSSKMASFISPMLATLIEEPFDNEEWLFEIKWDGYRALAFVDKGKVQLKSRANNLWNTHFSSLVEELKTFPEQVIFDGELVVMNSKGKPDFQLIQNYHKENKGDLVYCVFDLLFLNGEDLSQLPLFDRKEKLNHLLKENPLPHVRYSDHVIKNGIAFFKEANKQHLEGIIGKKISSTYESRRSKEWVKIKTSQRQEVVIGGFTAPRGSRKQLGALLVGVFDDEGNLKYVGHVGGGFNTNLLKEVYQKLKPLIQNKCSFKDQPKPNEAVTWVKPELVCEVSFAEWTKDNRLRQPIFLGLREDKPSKKVTREKATSLINLSKSRKKRKVELSNLDKVYWPKEKYTKGDLIDYYTEVSTLILPYLKKRPIVLHRFPEGIKGIDFYQKNIESIQPKWINTFPVNHKGKIDHYLLIDSLDSLLYAVNLGSIEIHPFLSQTNHLDNPDYCVIDLDPLNVPLNQVVEAALEVHKLLEKIKVDHLCKTSGGDGLHIYIPFHGKYTYEQSRQFAEIICHFVHEQLPRTTSLERSPKKRAKRVYLDCLQNRSGQTLAAPYSVRPYPHARVSTPLLWKEVNENLDLNQFTLKTAPARFAKVGDIFKPALGPAINLQSALMKLEKML